MNIYAASKVWHAPLWRDVRLALLDGTTITTTIRWIDYEEHSDIVMNRKGELWQHCLEDIAKADAMMIYCDDFREEQRGVLVEAGIAMALGKPVICINTCKTFSAATGVSDVAFTHHPLWLWANAARRDNWWLGFYEGFEIACEALQFRMRLDTLYGNSNIPVLL